MNNNALLQSICNALTLRTQDLTEFFQLCDRALTADELSGLAEDCSNEHLRCVLEGLIIAERGAREGGEPPHIDDTGVSNNEVLKKIRIAFNLQHEEMQLIFEEGGATLSRGEFSGLFRKSGGKNFRACSDELLLQFLSGFQPQLET